MKRIDKKINEFKQNIYEIAKEFTTNRLYNEKDLDPTILFCNKLKKAGFNNVSINSVKDDNKNLSRTYYITADKNFMEAYIHATYSFRTMSHEQYDMNVIVANIVTLE